MSVTQIPQFLENFNVYLNSNRLMGVSGDVTLPKFENIADTLSGAGILGELETPVTGAFKSQQLEVTFRTVDQAIFQAASSGTNALTFRGSQQINDYTRGGVVDQGIRVETRGPCKGFDLGKATPGKPTDSKLTQEILYIAIYIDDTEVLVLDKLNYIYRLMGVDMTSGIRSNI